MNYLDFIPVDELVEQDDSFVVPDLDTAILTACRDQAQIVSVGATDDVLFVAARFATLDWLLFERVCWLV